MAGTFGLFLAISNMLKVCLTGTITVLEASTSLKGQHFNKQDVLTPSGTSP